MAEGKKSVVLYVDLIHVFEELKDAEAGRLIKHYLRYVNDLNPEPPDKLTKVVFEPIKQQLKRDLVKWEKKSEKNSDNAKKRWNDAKNANASERIKADAKNADTVNDNVTVTDTVNVNVIVNEDEEGKKNFSPPPSDLINFKNVEDLAVALKQDQVWCEQVAMKLSTDLNSIYKKIDDFIVHLKLSKDTKKTEKDFAKHFQSWVLKTNSIVKNGKTVSGGFPDHWDLAFHNKLDGAGQSKYYQHLHSKGLKPLRNHRKDIIDFVKQ